MKTNTRKGGNALIIGLVAVVAVGIAGTIFTRGRQQIQESSKTVPQAETSVKAEARINHNDKSDTSLESDDALLMAELKSYDSQSSSVDQSFNDKPDNFQE